MRKWRFILISLLYAVQLTAFAAPQEKSEKTEEFKRVYMYGVAINFNDSTVYMTDIQHLDSMIINKEGSLQNYVGYSLQLKVYLEGTLGEIDQTCAIIYSDKKKKLEKRFLKMRKKYAAEREGKFKRIGTDSFTFQKR